MMAILTMEMDAKEIALLLKQAGCDMEDQRPLKMPVNNDTQDDPSNPENCVTE